MRLAFKVILRVISQVSRLEHLVCSVDLFLLNIWISGMWVSIGPLDSAMQMSRLVMGLFGEGVLMTGKDLGGEE